MLRKEFIAKMQKKLESKSKQECNDFLDAFIETVTETLARGDEVKLVNFGTFKLRKIAAHDGVDPVTLEKIKVKDIYIPFFKVGKGLKDNVTK